MWPADGPGFRPRPAEVDGRVPLRRHRTSSTGCVSTLRSSTSPSVPSTSTGPTALSGARQREVFRTHQLRAADAHRSQPLVAAGSRRSSPGGTSTGFLYLTDVGEAENPTKLVSVRRHGANVDSPYPVILPADGPAIYAAEHDATGVHGSYLVYRSDVWHRGSAFGDAGILARFNLGLAFKRAEHDWIGYDTQQSRSTGTNVDPVRGGFDTPRARLVRVSPAGASDLDRGTARGDRRPLPEARSLTLAGSASRRRAVGRSGDEQHPAERLAALDVGMGGRASATAGRCRSMTTRSSPRGDVGEQAGDHRRGPAGTRSSSAPRKYPVSVWLFGRMLRDVERARPPTRPASPTRDAAPPVGEARADSPAGSRPRPSRR